MIDSRLEIPEDILDGLKQLHGRGVSREEMIWYLFRADLSKPVATIALRLGKVMPSGETKEAVHHHPAYATRRESDEVFWGDAERAIAEIEQIDVAA